ncbi:Lon protease-like, mitochondrial [Symbiodinium microadriaticum]|uniref:Lon protease-like, mitochondrial n=1 Tax=Symbiodinium microadriaticum TaxID=2951 RepID=A0A1Q9EH92_SYMMI|nr:Lon protease-like, mitochondrial [Symbiodinium microadriaticum]
MEEWSVDFINLRCRQLFQGKVQCELSESKGRILRATCSFKRGDLLFEEPPLHIVQVDEGNEAFKLVKRICEKRDDVAYNPLWYWAAFSSLTADDLRTPPKVGCLKPVSRDQQQQLLCLYHEPVSEASATVESMVSELGLAVSPVKVEELLRLWILNCFEHSETPEGYSAYFVSSFMSHSCKPNAIWHEGADALHVVRARMDISEGDEVCISYLAEDVLMFSASHRKRALKKTKLFLCTCERCDERAASGTDPVDLCRGFRCPHCGSHIFPPLNGAVRAEDLAGICCSTCSRAVGEHAAGLLDTEKQLRLRLQLLDQACGTKPVEELITEADARQLEEVAGDQASSALGPQHWLCERLGTYMVPWYDSQGQMDEALKWMERRLRCQRHMFPWPNACRAWTMQKCSRLLIRRSKSMCDRQHPGKRDDSMQRRLLARAAFLQEEALQNLRVLFGESHRYTVRARKKLRRISSQANASNETDEPFDFEVAEILNAESAETRQRWRNIAGRIAPYPTEVIDGEEVIADFYGGETQHGLELRLHSGGSVAWGGLFAAFPLGSVHQRSERRALDLVHRSLARFFKQWPGGKQGNSFPHVFSAAARVGWRTEAGSLLQDWEAYLTNTSDPKCRLYGNGMVLGCGGTGLENVGGAAFATELLLQMPEGVLQVFPSLPLGMAASFHLRAPGPVMIRASRTASGFVTEFKMHLPMLEAELDMGPTVVRTDFLVQSPWPDSDILVDGQVAQVRGGIFHVGLSEGRLHEITPRNPRDVAVSSGLVEDHTRRGSFGLAMMLPASAASKTRDAAVPDQISSALMVFPADETPHSPMELLESDSVTESKHLGPMSPVSVSTEAVSPDAPSSADTIERSCRGCCSPSRLPVPWLDAEVLERAATFAHLPVPRERSGTGGVGSPSDEFPTVLGRVSAVRETSKSSSKSVAMPYNFAPSSPHSILSVPAPSYMARAWRREQGGGCEAAISNASGETPFGVRKWSIGVRTLLQLGDSHFADWLSFLALTTMVLVVTALYAVVMAPRDHEATIEWRRENPSVHVDKLGCDAVDHIGFYLILCVATFAGVAACLMFRNAGGSVHILSASGLALLSWFQGLVATVLPAHERAKSGCAYGTMQKIFAPQELSSYDRADYYKDYYGVIIVRTLLFLATLIWMQHLMVWRVLAVEATSRRFFGGRCLAVGIAVQKIAATVALAVSIWTYTSIGGSQTSSEEPFGAEVAESAITAHVKFWNNCMECEPYTGLMALQLSLGGMNFLLFVATGVTVIIIMSVILWDLGQAVRVTNDFTATHPRARRAGQQLRRARAVVRWQLFGVILHLVASSALLPVALEKLLDGRGYRSEPDLAISCSFQALELLTCVSAALILSGGYRRPIRHRSRADQPCSWQFATADSADSTSKCPGLRREKTDSRELGFERSSTAWNMKVAEIAGRGITVKELLGFYRTLRDVMPHYKATVHTTGDVVRHAIIPMTKESRSSYVQAFEGAGRSGRPQKMVTYYHIEGTEKKDAAVTAPGGSDLDKVGFDAKRYFDGLVSSGQLPELVKRANELDAEIKDLDGDMQMLVYENYSKFIRATDVIKQMKFTIEGLDPDLKVLEGNVSRITEHQKKVEDGTSGRAGRIEDLLKQQRVCRKLQVLFELPATLQKCLDRKAYGEAVEAYCCCSGFLRQYRHMPTFQKVLEEVELQMGRIRVALEDRLRSPELSVEEAVNSSVTLLDLGEDQVKVSSEYLTGRTGALRSRLAACFDPLEDAPGPEPGDEELSKDQEELRRPESLALHGACRRATETYVPMLCDAVEGFQKLLEVRSGSGSAVDENVLPEFVSARIEDLCDRITQLVDKKCPPTRVLVSCIHSVRDSLRRLHSLLPALLTRLFRAFLGRTAMDAMKALFATACSAMLTEMCKLHQECKKLGESSSSGLDDVLEEIAKTEQSVIMHGFTALTECQPLQSLLGPDKVAGQQLIRGLHSQLTTFFTTFTEVCRTYGATLQNYNNELVKSIEDLREKREELNRQILKEEEDKAKIQKELSILTDRLQKVNESLVRKTQARNEYDKTIQETEAAYMKILESSQTLLHVLKRETVNLTKTKGGGKRVGSDVGEALLPLPMAKEMKQVADLEWCGLFALALVRVGRHLEVKAINKVWGVAKDLFEGAEAAAAELQPNAVVLKSTRGAAQAVITQYATMSGQRLAHFFRNSVQSRNWMTVREPQEPRKVVEMVLREVHAFDAQLARLLGDPRKPKTGDHRRNLSRFKNSMELEVERLWAKKLQVFAPIPFNRNGAIVGILRIAFKAFFEYVREETFGKYGLQQIQLDCAFIAEMVRDFVENDDASVLDSLLDEVVASAQLRCVEPVAMDAHWWGNRFVDLCAAVVADALEESSYGLVSRLLQKDVDIIERILEKCGRLQDCYWICAFCVNQHASICDCNHHSRDSLTAQRYPVCDCGLPKEGLGAKKLVQVKRTCYERLFDPAWLQPDGVVVSPPEQSGCDGQPMSTPSLRLSGAPAALRPLPRFLAASAEGGEGGHGASEGAEGGEGTGEGTGEGAAQGAPPVEGGEVEELFALPLFRKPAFPGFYHLVQITSPQIYEFIANLQASGQGHYVAGFMTTELPAEFADAPQSETAAPLVSLPPDSQPPAEKKPLRKDTGKVDSVDELVEVGTKLQVVSLISQSPNSPGGSLLVMPTGRIRRVGVAAQDGPSLGPLFKLETVALPNQVVPSASDAKLSMEIRALHSEMVATMKELLKMPFVNKEQFEQVIRYYNLDDPLKLADLAAGMSSAPRQDLQEVLTCEDPTERLRKVLLILKKDLESTRLQSQFRTQIEDKFAKENKKFILMQQLRYIKRELNLERDDKQSIIAAFKECIKNLGDKVPEEAAKVMDQELSKLGTLEPQSAEFNVSRTYLEWLTALPWGKFSEDNTDIEKAEKILNEDHYSLEDVKERILEHMAVSFLKGSVHGKIMCLVGPPGVGKTSIGKSIARALDSFGSAERVLLGSP